MSKPGIIFHKSEVISDVTYNSGGRHVEKNLGILNKKLDIVLTQLKEFEQVEDFENKLLDIKEEIKNEVRQELKTVNSGNKTNLIAVARPLEYNKYLHY